jgi:hypothetical protein
VTKAITAAVIATLNVNIRFRPLAHCNSETKKDRSATANGPFAALRRGDRRHPVERRGWHRSGADHPAGVALQH